MATPTLALPSGDQHEIVADGRRAVVTEVGATLRSFSVDGVEVLDGFDDNEMSSAGRGQVLAPWPNRLQDGSFRFGGREGRAALDEPERANAIHGLVRWLPWRVLHKTAGAVSLTCVLHPQPAYPWRLELEVGYRLDAGGLTVSASATDRSDIVAPFGIGFHPYLTAATPMIDDATLMIPAKRRLLSDSRGLPTGDEPVEGTDLDFIVPRRIGGSKIDTAFTELERDAHGRASVQLAGARAVRVWMDRSFGHVMMYTGDTLTPASRRRRGIAIEPMTCPPNALRTGTDLIRLEPDAPWGAEWGIQA